MPRPSRSIPAGILGSIPSDLSEDGTPVTVTQKTTFTKERGQSPMENQAEQIDLDEQTWMVDKQGKDGWYNIDTFNGRPFAPQLREAYGPGKYRITPIGPNGKPIAKLFEIVNVGSPVESREVDEEEDEDIRSFQQEPLPGTDDMPHWMRLQMYQAEQERKEARKRAEEAEFKRQEWDREQRAKEYERQLRIEAAEERRREQEAEDRRNSQARTDKMIEMGMGLFTTLATTFVAAKNSPPQMQQSPDDRLLNVLLEERKSRSSSHQQFRETLEMLALVDGIRQPREDYGRREEEEDDDPVKMITKIAPLLALIRGQAPMPVSGPEQVDLQGIMRQVIRDPAAIRMLAKEDPKGIAKVIMQAVKDEPVLEAAVIEAFQEAQGSDQEAEPKSSKRKLKAAPTE